MTGTGRFRSFIDVLNPRFARLLGAMFVLNMGTSITNVALPIFIIERYGFGAELGVSLVIRILPMLVVGGAASWALARFDARHVAVIGTLLAGVTTALLPLTTNLVQLNLLSAISGLAAIFAGPALMMLRSGVIPTDNAMKGNGLVVVAERSPQVIGPAAAIPVLALGGVEILLYVEAAATCLAALLVIGLPAVDRGNAKKGASIFSLMNVGSLRRIANGLSRVQAYLVTGLFYTVAVSAGRLLLIALATYRFADEPSALALLLGAMALGAVVGGLVGGQFPPKLIGLIYVAGNVLEAFIWLGVGASSSLAVSLVLLFVAGTFESVATTAFFADLQLRLSPAAVGQFFAFFIPITSAAAAFGTLIGTFAISAQSVWVGATVVACLIALPFIPYLKTYLGREGPELSPLRQAQPE